MLNDIAIKTYTDDFKINAKFIYNYYDSQEAQIDDNKISSSVEDVNDVKKRYIKIFDANNSFKNLISQNTITFLKQNYTTIADFIESINYKNFNEKQDVFNKIENFFPHRRALYTTQSDIDLITLKLKLKVESNGINDINEITQIDQNDGTFIQNFIQTKMSFEKDEFDISDIKNQFMQNQILTETVSELKKMKSIKLNTLDLKSNNYINNGDFLGNCSPFCTFINTNDEQEDYTTCLVGYYIEKFLVSGDNNNKIASMFYTPFFEKSSYNKNSLYIEDGSVKYGSTYVYSISKVFCYILPKKNNYLFKEAYFICDYPYITKKINCVDNELPLPADNLNINLINDELEISWTYPTNSKGDVKGMQILKRFNLDEPYTVISYEINDYSNDYYIQKEKIDSNLIKINKKSLPYSYIDSSFDKSKPQIYTVRSISAHGSISNYAIQIAVMYDWINKKLIYELISEKNAPFDYPNIYVNNNSYMFDEIDTSIENTPVNNNFSKVNIYITPDCVFLDENKTLYENEKYKFTMMKLNDKTINDISFNIKNFNL